MLAPTTYIPQTLNPEPFNTLPEPENPFKVLYKTSRPGPAAGKAPDVVEFWRFALEGLNWFGVLGVWGLGVFGMGVRRLSGCQFRSVETSICGTGFEIEIEG